MTTHRVGVIADTHGLLRPEALRALEGTELIVHAGDVGDPLVLSRLGHIAPTVAVRGNVDVAPWAQTLPLHREVTVGTARLHVVHIVHDLAVDPAATGLSAVIFGHSHKPLIERRDGVLFLNPGAAGARRFRLPVTVARLTITSTELAAEIIELQV